ncbi:murein transglycosylase domain-containing protein [Pseudoalteromonas sp. MMG024]|uniref:murein transglycosylase domain-containing protein n=1 Tax=Pseudoalteromonas sp. MMG024 TaxID=2909980 RepID=UPI001F15A6B3|nr:murein transglycosylase domain-containing protein [Pseudoalteromonas sp. MMG024]MCF6455927.1 murein transglycosylase domain-containing protein [Pseudoalteromonas sp. MMG024]
MQYRILLIGLLLSVASCKSTVDVKSPKALEKLSKQIEQNPHDIVAIAKGVEQSTAAIKTDTRRIRQLFDELDSIIKRIWGNKHSSLPSNKRYVKYSNNYQARAIVDFEKGTVKVETIATKKVASKLAQAVFETLLTTDDPSTTDIFSSNAPNLSGEPFLYPQVRDHDGELVRFEWRARRYANYLVDHYTKIEHDDNRQFSSVSFKLVNEHQHLRHLKYSNAVLAAAKRYNINAALIYAVIETESAFNPYAVSRSNAYGLMQIMPATAGRDVFKLEKGKTGQPSKAQLMQPNYNIDIGTAYLKILNTRYLKGVENKRSREYTVISAYNGGAGNVLKTYHSNRDTAVKLINRQNPGAVYQRLRHHHPRQESRRYLEKVTNAKQKYH